MDFYKRNPIFYTLLLGLLCVGLAGIWILAEINGELQILKRSYESKSAQYARYLAARPSPTRSNLEALQENYADLYAVFEETMRVLDLNTYDRAAFFGRTPASRADWSFELHRFRENARYGALSKGIALPANAQFGVEDLANGAPPSENMQSVHEQVVIMATLLQILYDSSIESFVRIQRGRPLDGRGSSPISRRSGERLFTEGDEFPVAKSQSSAIPGVLETHTFRVVFSGQSVALRSFLNRIVDSNLPFVIRGVEVDLASEGGAKLGLETIAENPFSNEQRSPEGASFGVPIISENRSMFVVTLEFLDFIVEIEPPEVVELQEGEVDA